jgi:hypothetical protein
MSDLRIKRIAIKTLLKWEVEINFDDRPIVFIISKEEHVLHNVIDSISLCMASKAVNEVKRSPVQSAEVTTVSGEIFAYPLENSTKTVGNKLEFINSIMGVSPLRHLRHRLKDSHIKSEFQKHLHAFTNSEIQDVYYDDREEEYVAQTKFAQIIPLLDIGQSDLSLIKLAVRFSMLQKHAFLVIQRDSLKVLSVASRNRFMNALSNISPGMVIVICELREMLAFTGSEDKYQTFDLDNLKLDNLKEVEK